MEVSVDVDSHEMCYIQYCFVPSGGGVDDVWWGF